MHALYQMKILLRQKGNLFWALAFPIFLGIVFYFMFGNLATQSLFEEIPIGVIAKEDSEFVTVAKEAEMEDGKKMFQITSYDERKEAEDALSEGTIRAVVDEKNDLRLTVIDSDTDISFIKTFLEQYKQNVKMVEDVMKNHPEQIYELVEKIEDSAELSIEMKNVELKGQDKDCYSQYFFAVLAMACLIASNVGASVGNKIQADRTTIAARRNVAPTKKMKQLFTDYFASFVVYDMLTIILLLVMVFGLKRDFGTNLPLVVLATFVGNMNGLATGLCLAVFSKGGEKKVDGLCVGIFMVSSFLAGLQWADITYRIEKVCPIINRINPATLIVNSYKSLAVFGDVNKYWTNVLTLLAITIVVFVISVLKLRRTKYAII